MDVHQEQTDFYQQKLLSIASKTKEDFISEYQKYDETNAAGFYLQVLTELAKAMAEGNVDSLKMLSNLIEYVSDVKSQATLTDYYNNASNPIRGTNLVILACKYNKVEILKFIFINSKVLDNLSVNIGMDVITPNDKDETCHDAFYYAIRLDNVELLDTLINKWPGDYFATHSEELDRILSRAYEELKLKNVLLSDETEIFVESILINLRFFSHNSEQAQGAKDDLSNIRDRVNIVLENIGLLKAEYLNEKNVDEKFLFTAKFIAQNIHILKQQLKSTYDRLPWEEIEFCLVSFVSCHLKRQEINLFYRSTLNKSRLLNHLENFAKKLYDEKDIEDVGIHKLSDLPKLKREKVVTEIIINCPEFEELYKDHQYIRDIHSLMKISDYIKLALSADPKKREGELIITRVLQVIGEYLKNTLESPKLSNTTSELLLLSLPKNTRKIITDLRNSLSYADSLSKRPEIKENKDENFYIGVQNDTKKVGVVITDILYNNKIKMIRILTNKIVTSDNLDEIKEVAMTLRTVQLDTKTLQNFKIIEHEKLEKLIKELSGNITDKMHYEQQLLNRINLIINNAGAVSENFRNDYIVGYTLLKSFNTLLSDNMIDQNGVRRMKFNAKQILNNMTHKIEHHTLNEIAKLLMKISHSIGLRVQSDNLDEQLNRIIYEILYIVEFETGGIRYIDEVRNKLIDNGSFNTTYKERETFKLEAKKYDHQLAPKLSELKNILSNNLSNGQSIETFSSYKNDKKLQAVVEMLVLDIMSILAGLNNCLENNLLFLDDNTPLLNGKCLHNYLAHDNALVDILLSHPSIAVLLNAKKLIEEDIMKSRKKIGKLVTDDCFMLKEKYDRDLVTITNQERMFMALEEGNLESLKDCLKEGADINARRINSWTALHFAAKGPSLEVIKFIFDQNLNPNVKDTIGQSPLHVAAAYGRKNIVEFLIKEAGFYVDDPDDSGITPLHITAQNGYKDTVEVLLENKATISIQSTAGVLPLHYAIKNNHIDIVKILLVKDANVNINEAVGNFTPLHGAAGGGHLELVNFLLQHKADTNLKDDRDLTALHAAALNGYHEVVEALILKEADVNARDIDGCTPLHYAVENGHEKIASVLLRHGANVNVVDKTYNNTPLHYVAKDGHGEIVKILLKNGANASVDTVGGVTPLHFAVQSGHVEIVTTLLEHGVNIQAKDINEDTPLHYAVEHGNAEVAKLLIKYGAEVNARTNDNVTPLHIAALEGYQDIVDLLINNKAQVNAEDIKGNTPLHTAAGNGSIDLVDLLIKNRAEVNARSHDGTTPLHVAALNGHSDVIVFLIKNKAIINAKLTNGITPLHGAITGGHTNVVSLLIKNKAAVNAGSTTDIAPLILASEIGHKDIVEVLIASGANVNVRSNNVMPLLSAIKYNHKEIVEVLIANGANVNGKVGEPLALAILAGYTDIVEILFKNKAHVDVKGPENTTSLHLAAKRGHTKIVNVLLKRGAYVDVKATGNVTPLYCAAQEGHVQVVEILIANKANFNIRCNEGSPLHIAVGRGHESVVKVLLNNRAKINIKDNLNRIPLQLAVIHGHLQIVKMLFQYRKVDMEMKDGDDWTLLHIASQQSNLEMVKYLVAEGSDINAINAFGSKSIHIAAREGHKDTVEFFFSKGLSIDVCGAANQTLLHYAAHAGKLEVVKYLISKGADVNALDANGLNPMHMAAHFGSKDVIDILLKNGTFYNAVDNLNRTPLEMSDDKKVTNLLLSTEKLFEAVKNDNALEVESCIEAGVIVNSKSAVGGTPLHHAAWKGYDTIVNVLLQNKADPNAVIKNGITPLHYAAKFSHVKIVKALLSDGAVYNAVSDSGKTPLDFTVDKSITTLFQLVSQSFENIKNGNSKVINDLNRIKDVDIIKAVMGARNRENQTLVVAATYSNFSKLEQLKQILQCDVSSQIDVALVLLRQCNYQRALSIFKSEFEKTKEILGPSNPGILVIQMHIAKTLYAQGSYQEALNTCKEIFQKQEEILGLNAADTLSTRGMIALVLYRQGKDEEALNIYREVCLKQKEILGPNHMDTLNTQFHMALVLGTLGKYKEALNINRVIFEKRRDILGANAPDTLHAQNNIAMVLSSQRKYKEALKIYKEVYQKKKLVFGINHSDTLRTLSNIAEVLFNQQKYPEALQTQQEVLDIQKQVLGPNHPDTLYTQYTMANILYTQGKWISALLAYKESFHHMKAFFGPNHPTVLGMTENMKMINTLFRLKGDDESEILQWLQKKVNMAASIGDIQTIQRLINAGTDVNDKDTDGRTPLHYAVTEAQLGVVNILLKAGADVTQVTNKGDTPLHTASSKGYKEIVDVLLHHINRNQLDDFINAKTVANGTTSLHVAAKNGYLEIVKSLLQSGAIYDMKNKENKTPLDLCEDKNITDLLKLIENLFKDAKNGNVEIISKLKAVKPDEFVALTNARNDLGYTLLLVAITNKHKNIASKVLDIVKTSRQGFKV